MRVAVVDQPFTVLGFVSPEMELPGLTVSLLSDPAGTPIFTIPLESSATLQGAYSGQVTIAESGQYLLHYECEELELDFWEDLNVVESSQWVPVQAPTTPVVGLPWYDTVQDWLEFGDTTVVDIYDSSLTLLFTRSYEAIDGEDGSRFRFSEPVTFTSEGAYLFVIRDSEEPETATEYAVYDVFQPIGTRVVELRFAGPDLEPYPSIYATILDDRQEIVESGRASPGGVLYCHLVDGSYTVTARDTERADRVFDVNNFVLTVAAPTEEAPNLTTFTLSYLDVGPVQDLSVPAEYRSLMRVQVLVGPEGIPGYYRKFTVEQLTSWRGAGLVLIKGDKSYLLDSNGRASVSLIRGSEVRVSFPGSDVSVRFTVPDSAEFLFSDISGTDPFTIVIPRIYRPYSTSPQ
jgi:hypothetical protein